MFFHSLAFVIVVGTIFIIHKVRKTTLAKQKVYTTVTTVPKKDNPHPVFLPEIVGEVQSYLDMVSLGKCRLINSEWSNIAAAKLKNRIHEFEDNHPCYRPTEEELAQHLTDAQLTQFQKAPNKYLRYKEDYKLRYHIEDQMLSISKNKKIFDISPELSTMFPVEYLNSKECPFLFKLRFTVKINREGNQLDFYGFPFNQDLPCPIGFKDVPDVYPGHVFEAVVDLHERRAYNIRIYSVPDTVLGIFPTGDFGWILFYVLAFPMLLGDLWQIYYIHKLIQSLFVLFLTYYFTVVIAANPPLRVGFAGSYIFGLVWYRGVVVEIVKLVSYTTIGYMAQRIIWELYRSLATTKTGSKIIAGIFFFELILINNLRLLWHSILSGDILLAFLENNLIYGLIFFQYFLWVLVQKEFTFKKAFEPIIILRFYSTVILYTFYNPIPWLLFDPSQ